MKIQKKALTVPCLLGWFTQHKGLSGESYPLTQFPMRPLVVIIRKLLAGSLALAAQLSTAHADLPIPSNAAALTTTPIEIATQGHAEAALSGNALTIKQSTDKASIAWQSFNIGVENSVHFEQPSATAVALNTIQQADASRILGRLTANGQVYLVNQNGFVFGEHAQVNVNSLVASTLGVSEAAFQNGLTNAFVTDGSAALQGNGELYIKDSQGQPVLDKQGQKIKIQIMLEPGAQLTTTSAGGRVIIAAPLINNAGTITTPDGQTILAAAQDKVYLQEAGSGSDIRGLLVEVGTGGAVNNNALGKVIAERGNASLLGFAVNQEGIVSATTSVNLNGSVRLLAREGHQDPSGTGGKLLPQATSRTLALADDLGTKATLQVGRDSFTGVNLDTSTDANGKPITALDAQAQSHSVVELSGHDVLVHEHALVQAKSGTITMTALDDPTDSTAKGDAQIVLEAGSVVDASGVKEVPLPMERNVLSVELRKNELRDAPLQRDGVLYGKKINVDLRDVTMTYGADGEVQSATIPIADIKGAVDRIARTIAERSTSGGVVSLSTSGALMTHPESKIDISGGSVRYQEGFIDTTQLLSQGQLYPIATADPNRHYDSLVAPVVEQYPALGVTDSWTLNGLGGHYFAAGYTEGKSGGQVLMSAYGATLAGNFEGKVEAGALQRTVAERAVGSSFSLDLSNNNLLAAQDIVFNGTQSVVVPSESTVLGLQDDALNQGALPVTPLNLSADVFERAGMSQVSIKTNGKISLANGAYLSLPANGVLDMAATGFNINGSITIPSGTVKLHPVTVAETLQASAITVAAGATIDVAGRWLNDVDDNSRKQALSVIAHDGGSIALQAEQGELRLATGSHLDVSGGAWLDSHITLHSGLGGALSLAALSHEGGGAQASLNIEGELTGFGLNQGGSLALSTNAVFIGAAQAIPSPSSEVNPALYLRPDFFQQGGFAAYQVTATVAGLQVAEHAQLVLQQQNWLLADNLVTQATGSKLTDFSRVVTLPDALRKPMHLGLSFSELLGQNRAEQLSIGQGALLSTDAGGSVEITSDTSIMVEGTINAPAGQIALTLNTPSVDKGFFAEQKIWLGQGSHLQARGVFMPDLNTFGLRTGEVAAGGDIKVTAKRGYIIAHEGSTMDVSGTTATLDFVVPTSVPGQYHTESTAISSDGGSISLAAGEGLLADGLFHAQGGNAHMAGGTLSVELNSSLRNKSTGPNPGDLFPDDSNPKLPRTLMITATDGLSIPSKLSSEDALDANMFSGRAFLSNRQINEAGFASLLFKSDVLGVTGNYAGSIQFQGDVSLHATRQIVLDTPTIKTSAGQLSLTTAYAKLGSSSSRIDTEQSEGGFFSTLAPAAKTGEGSVIVNAQGIDLVGGLSFNGINNVVLNSQGDVRTVGIRPNPDPKNFLGEFKLAGDLTINASQLYPASLSDYAIMVTGSDDQVLSIFNSGEVPAPVYSAGGKLSLSAPTIMQAGTINVPFGTLTMTATKSLTLAAGSVTSVSGAGLTIPFGQGSGGLTWLYPLDSNGNKNSVIDSPPEKHIALTAPNIALEKHAKIDLSGGGNLYAHEFITGPGGSIDSLDASATEHSHSFAIMPKLDKALTPYDPYLFATTNLQVGDSVYLSSGSALAAAWYSLLPAYYALLPGAYLVTPQAGTQDLSPAQALTTLAGSTVVAGRYGVASAGSAAARWQGFVVEEGALARTRAQYSDYFATTFFSAKAATNATVVSALPDDAGSLAINAQTGLTMGAQVVAAPDNNGRGGQVDISAEHLAIVANQEALAALKTGTVGLLAEDLNQLHAPSILLGGVRSKTSTGQLLTVSSQTLSVEDEVSLTGEEWLLAASDEVRINAGATLLSSGKTATAGVALRVVNQATDSSDGALLRLSAQQQSLVSRDNTVTGKAGTLIVEPGAHLSADNSLFLESTKNTIFAGAIDMQGGSLALKASKISLGQVPAETQGLVLSQTQFALDELLLTSASDVDIYGGVDINAGLLSIDAASINGFNNTLTPSTLSATTLTLTNTAATASRTGLGEGVLAVNTNYLHLAEGAYALNGFANINVNASSAIKGVGQQGLSKLTVAGDLQLNTGQFIGAAGSTTELDGRGHQVIISALGEDVPTTLNDLGASWAITADTVRSHGRFDLPAGKLTLTAVKGDVDVLEGSRIDLSGRTLDFTEVVKSASAGKLALSATAGHVNIAEGATIQLAGATYQGQQSSAAGVLAIHAANGQFNWQGNISALHEADAVSQFQQGQFQLEVNSLGAETFSALTKQLKAAGFTDTLQFQQHSGDITLAATDSINAHHLSLHAEQGLVTVNGTLNASGAQGGDVTILGGKGITVGATGAIVASASNPTSEGGRVLLDTVQTNATGSGYLDLSALGGTINVAGGAAAQGGTVQLRTGRDDALQTLKLSELRTHIIGADSARTTLEATRVYAGYSSINSKDIAAWQQDTQQFMNAVPRLENYSGAEFEVLPGLDIRGAAQLSLNNQWDLLAWRYSDSQGKTTLPGMLTLRAGDDLTLNASLTDGFATAFLPGQTSMQLADVVQPGRSWSYHLIAGGDLNLASHYVAPSLYGTGELVTSQVRLRTSTGDIKLNAEGDMSFLTDPNDSQAAAAVYTMGAPAEFTRGQLISGAVPGYTGVSVGETEAEYLNQLNPAPLNSLLRYGYVNEALLGLAFTVAEYPSQGGAITVQAGGNIRGINTGQQSSDWLVRSGVLDKNNRPTAWGINLSGDRTNAINGISAQGKRFFNQNIGSFGGGDVTILAGGEVRDLSVMLPSTGKPFGQLSTAINQWVANGTEVNGGGDLHITSEHSIFGGEFFVGRGTATINTGGGIRRADNGLGAVLALAAGSVNLTARQEVVIASVLNPTVLKQSNVLPMAAGGDSLFLSYQDDSAVNLTATSGNVVLANDVDALRIAKGLDTGTSSGFEYALYPSILRAAALSGDVRIDRSMTLMPSSQRALEVLAYGSIGTNLDAAQLININMSDAEPRFLPSVSAPTQQLEGSLSDGLIRLRERLDASTPDATLIHTATPTENPDSSRALFIAKQGDISFSSAAEVTFFLPHAAVFSAGRDINNLSISGQHLSAQDVTQIKAGRDISFDALISSDGVVLANNRQIELGGPGQLDIQAGRNISLGGSMGINTIGNTKNAALSANEGAEITLLAGVSAALDYAGFSKKYFSLSSPYLQDLRVLDSEGNNLLSGLSAEQKLAYVQQLSEAHQQSLFLAVLSNEIKLAATQAASAPNTERKAAYQVGYDAINTLLPSHQYQGDLSLVFSQIKTLAGGDINLVVPGGAVNVGLAGKLAGIAKGAEALGIVAQQQGEVSAVSQGDFNVNQSRVFTMGGGDIVVWSANGNIDAGKGAKSAISAPAPITSVDAKGNITTLFPPVVSGSGIQTILPNDKTKAQGNVYLAAPVGIIDAGEAGISGGNIIIAATAVVGAANISATGGAVGVPTAVSTPVVPSGAASAAASAGKQLSTTGAEDADDTEEKAKKKTAISMLSVEVVGYGECSTTDVREGNKGCGS